MPWEYGGIPRGGGAKGFGTEGAGETGTGEVGTAGRAKTGFLNDATTGLYGAGVAEVAVGAR
jgi:hypothetical protein